MATSHRIYWLLGITAVCSGVALFVTQMGSVKPGIASSEGLRAQGNVAAAIEDRSLALHSEGIKKALLGDYPSAIADYDRALMLSPENPEIYYNRAVAHYSVGHSEQAVQDFDRAIQLQPTMAEAYANRSTLHLESGDPARALADGQRAVALFEQQGEPGLAAEMRDWLQQHKIRAIQ